MAIGFMRSKTISIEVKSAIGKAQPDPASAWINPMAKR